MAKTWVEYVLGLSVARFRFGEQEAQKNNTLIKIRWNPLYNYLPGYRDIDCETCISYRHNSAEPARLAVLGILKEMSLRYWYDDGIKVGDEWSKMIDQRNKDCSAFILLLTKDYFDSQECRREFNLAREQDKPMIIIAIDQAEIHHFSQLESYASKQHIDLKPLIIYDVLQKDSLKEKLHNRAKELQLIGEWD